jgi:hypothetical protein
MRSVLAVISLIQSALYILFLVAMIVTPFHRSKEPGAG